MQKEMPGNMMHAGMHACQSAGLPKAWHAGERKKKLL